MIWSRWRSWAFSPVWWGWKFLRDLELMFSQESHDISWQSSNFWACCGMRCLFCRLLFHFITTPELARDLGDLVLRFSTAAGMLDAGDSEIGHPIGSCQLAQEGHVDIEKNHNSQYSSYMFLLESTRSTSTWIHMDTYGYIKMIEHDLVWKRIEVCQLLWCRDTLRSWKQTDFDVLWWIKTVQWVLSIGLAGLRQRFRRVKLPPWHLLVCPQILHGLSATFQECLHEASAQSGQACAIANASWKRTPLAAMLLRAHKGAKSKNGFWIMSHLVPQKPQWSPYVECSPQLNIS